MKPLINAAVALALTIHACAWLALLAHGLHHFCMSRAETANSPAVIAVVKAQNAFLNALGL